MSPKEPVDELEKDEQFAQRLAAYDEALRCGTPPPGLYGQDTVDSSPEFQQARACLQRLERHWPRSPATTVAWEGQQTPNSPETGELSACPRQIGRFEVEQELGRGGFGVVFLAYDPMLKRRVALKVPQAEALLTPHLRRRFLREAEAAARLDHPNLVPVHEAGEFGTLCYMASAYCPGTNLSRWLKQQDGPLDPRLAAALGATLAEAVEHGHQHGVLHRDLKPSNVLLVPKPESSATDDELPFVPRVTDFGLAKLLEENADVTRCGTMLGTPAYVPPEQASGQVRQIDARSDVYSLGVILYELLTGRRPFPSEPPLIYHQILHNDPPRPRHLRRSIPRDLETICLKAMEKAPETRYQSAQEMADDLRRFLRSEPIQARPVGRFGRWWRWTRRNPLLAIGLLVIAILALAMGGFAWENRQLRQPPPPFHQTVQIATDPARARMAFVPLDPTTGRPDPHRAVRPDDRSPITVELEPGKYLVVAAIFGHGFHEVYRTVPEAGDQPRNDRLKHDSWQVADGRIVLPEIRILPEEEVVRNLTYFDGGEFTMGTERWPRVTPPHRRYVEPFYLQTTEVTIDEYRGDDGTLPSDMQQRLSARDGHDPVAFVTYDEAANYAEQIGMRLPTEAEYEFAATMGGTRRFPWGDDEERIYDWTFGPAGEPTWDHTPTDPPVFGLFSNVTEWTASRYTPYPNGPAFPPQLMERIPISRVIRGGPSCVSEGHPNPRELSLMGDPRYRLGADETADSGPYLGFRCARSAEPRFLD